jgi:membrane protein DedA with SNARE-associated domain
MTAVDGVVPPVPSETLVIAVAVAATTGEGPSLALLVLVAAAGAFCGDLVAYAIGTRLPVRRMRLFRSERGRLALDRAERALHHRGASFIVAGRFIPVGRVAVNMTAGATGFPLRRFLPAAGLAGLTWAVYTTALGIGAGVFLGEHPLAAMLVGVATGLTVGAVVDTVVTRRSRRAPG